MSLAPGSRASHRHRGIIHTDPAATVTVLRYRTYVTRRRRHQRLAAGPHPGMASGPVTLDGCCATRTDGAGRPIDGRGELQKEHYGTFWTTAQHRIANQTRANIIIKDSAVYYLVNDQITNVQPIKFKLALQYIVPTSSISPSATTAFKSGGLQHEIIHQHVAGRNCCMWEEDN
jgi:hypothetical protein